MHRKYLEKIIEKGSPEDMECLGELMIMAMDALKDYDEELYEKIEMKMYVMAYGYVLTEDMANKIVEEMRPMGKKWGIDQTTAVKKKYELDKISDVDFYVVMNMVANDNRDTVEKFAKSEEEQLDMYVHLAKDFILDPDAKEGKVFTYFMKIPK